VTPEREKTLLFSKPYLNFHICWVTRKDEDLSSKSLADKRIGVRVSTEAEDYLKSNFKHHSLKLFDSNEEMYQDLINKEIDTLVDDSPIAYGFTKRIKDIVINSVIPDTASQYAIIINEGNTGLKIKIDGIIDNLVDCGFLKTKRDDWFGEAKL